MNSNMYSQTDSRWRKKKYPSGGYNVGNSGCGLCAVTHVLIEQSKYAKATPSTFHSYMRQYATRGNGTKWVGITNGLKHFGHKSVKELECQSSKSKVFTEFNKGNRMAVALFTSGKAPDGTVWTNGGHYISFLDFKVDANGKHWFYVKDSGGRHRRGWYCVEKSMGKKLKRVWIVERLGKPTPPKPYKPTKLKIDGDWGKATTKLTQHVLGVTVDGDFGKVTKKALQKFLNKNGADLKVDGDFGKASIKALQRFLKVKADGNLGKVTVKAWQKFLNTKVK